MQMTILRKTGNNLKKIRKNMRISQEEVARRCGIAFSTYARIENGKELPSIVTALLIADALNESIEKLFFLKK
jgi:putative transcriptional regulator